MEEAASTFWSSERMNSAVPRCKISANDEKHPSSKDVIQAIKNARKSSHNTTAEVVGDSECTQPPFSAVGRLFYSCGGCLYTGSAYVAEWDGKKNILFTAAHNLFYPADVPGSNKAEESRYIMFVPAMRGKDDYDGPYGRFAAADIGWNENWDPDNGKTANEYDFGIIHLAPRKSGSRVLNVSDVVTPIGVSLDPVAQENTGTFWQAIGYPAMREDNEEIKMMKQTGVLVPRPGERSIARISKEKPFGTGSSGGVWLRGDDSKANGVQVGSCESMSYSPHFTLNLLTGITYSTAYPHHCDS